MPFAVVTGATSGIGLAFARHLAGEGYDLLLVARSADSLNKVATEIRTMCRVRVEALPADLTTVTGCEAVTERFANGPAVELLVNNAGIALSRPFLDNGIAAEEALLHLNVQAVLRLTHAVLPGMLARCAGMIVNVSSFTAAGMSGLSTTYPASKAWILSFSEALGRSSQLRRSGVHVMALLPGFTRTEFFNRSNIEVSHLPSWIWLCPTDVVSTAMRDLRRGKHISVPSLRYKTATWALRHLPRSVLRHLAWDLGAPGRLWARPLSADSSGGGDAVPPPGSPIR
ncbi:SDR family oxidoreductase [Streptomyces sp. DK15]|uniref:SDR family NAD(P)-dependent oxidoreductase n=1 Tax=Streptomyces sp. DK15 TaxID=2957499 RepID=UPI0029BA2AFA|nr:SDR family oxidoreductase [Streptomyces sp. DK15]MDX2395211.1 SDR family oxidoreductase [Streptomyces sp. DK15]